MALFQHSSVFNWFALKRPYAKQKSFKNLSSGQRSSCRGSPPSCALAPPVPPVGSVPCGSYDFLRQVRKHFGVLVLLMWQALHTWESEKTAAR